MGLPLFQRLVANYGHAGQELNVSRCLEGTLCSFLSDRAPSREKCRRPIFSNNISRHLVLPLIMPDLVAQGIMVDSL